MSVIEYWNPNEVSDKIQNQNNEALRAIIVKLVIELNAQETRIRKLEAK